MSAGNWLQQTLHWQRITPVQLGLLLVLVVILNAAVILWIQRCTYQARRDYYYRQSLKRRGDKRCG